MRRYREITLEVPTGDAAALYERLQRLAQRHRGPTADVRAWLLTMLGAVADAMEAELLRQDAQGRLIVPAAAMVVPRRPGLTVGPLVVG